MSLFLEFVVLFFIAIYSYLEAFVKLFIPAKRKSVRGEIVLITGAGHGIGRFTAFEFAKLQSIVVLWDINKKGVEETAEQCRNLGAKAYAYEVDCSKRNNIYSTAEKVKADVGDVDILINNAGVVMGLDFLSLKDQQIEKTFEVNILAHLWTTKAFLPAMVEKNRGHIATVASIVGHIGAAFLVDYCTTKFAAVGFHTSLTTELADLGKDGIKTSCLCPVFVDTGFVQKPRTRLWPILKTEDVAKSFVDGIIKNEKMIFVPSNLKMFLVLIKFLPQRVIDKLNKMQDVKFGTKHRSISKTE
ncbi:17-beta-hydroxysteroid dehydrogenase 13-like [Gastrophryne carolinensis]